MKQQYQYMHGSKNSRPGEWIQGVSAIKNSFFVLNLFYRSQLVYFKENFIFHGSRGEPSILPVVRMVSNFFQGGGGGIQVLNYSLSKPI